MFSVTNTNFGRCGILVASNSMHNTAQMARQRVAPDEILSMSQASRKSDDGKISSGVSPSQRSDELLKIVQDSQFQPLPLKQLYRVIGCSRCSRLNQAILWPDS